MVFHSLQKDRSFSKNKINKASKSIKKKKNDFRIQDQRRQKLYNSPS